MNAGFTNINIRTEDEENSRLHQRYLMGTERKTSKILKTLNTIKQNLTTEQLNKLEKMVETKNVDNLTNEDAINILSEIGFDNSQKTKVGKKIGVNEKCSCKSGLKYKKCCMLKSNG